MEHNLTKGHIGNTLLKFAIPFLLASLLQALYGAADLFMVGKYTGSSAVSAVALGSQLMQTITYIILAFTTGATVVIGNYIGANKKEEVASTIGTTAVSFFIIAIILTPIMVLSTNFFVDILKTPAEAVIQTREYIFICSVGIPFIVGYNAVSGVFRGLGDSNTPLFFVLIACIINVILDYILVGLFNMGAVGAAFATVVSQAISFVCAFFYMKIKGFSFDFNKTHLKFNKEKAKEIFKIGTPIATQDGLVHISFLIISAIINTMGLVASASMGVVEKLLSFAMLIPSAFSGAVAAMTAQNMGAKEERRAVNCLYYGIFYSLIFGIAICVYCQFFPETLTSIFSSDKDVIAQGGLYLKSYSMDCIIVSFVFCANAFFNGCGNSLFPMIHSLIATFIVRIPVSYLLSKIPGITMYELGLAAPLATTLSLIICIFYFKYRFGNFLPKDNLNSKTDN